MAGIENLHAPQAQDTSVEDLVTSAFTTADISLLEMVKIQAQVLVPLLKTLRAELGEERANQLATKALREWMQKIYQEIGTQLPGSPRQKWETIMAVGRPRIGTDIALEVLTQEAEALEFNIMGCRYADFFRQLGEPELGALLVCNADLDVVAVGSPQVTMTRTQTIMQGAKYCDFRYQMKADEGSD